VDIKKGKGRSKQIFLLASFLLVLVAVIGCSSQQVYQSGSNNTGREQTDQASVIATSEMQNNKHSQLGLSCEQCHSEGVGSPVSQDQCLSCHQSMEAVATKTVAMEPNPHGPHHYDTADCTTCHAVHQKSQMMCSTCHAFNWIEELDEEKWEKL